MIKRFLSLPIRAHMIILLFIVALPSISLIVYSASVNAMKRLSRQRGCPGAGEQHVANKQVHTGRYTATGNCFISTLRSELATGETIMHIFQEYIKNASMPIFRC